MTKWQEEDLLQDIHKAVKIFERFVSVLEKTNDRKKVEVIRCEECKYWDTEWKSTDERYHYCWKNDSFEERDFWCKNGERKKKE